MPEKGKEGIKIMKHYAIKELKENQETLGIMSWDRFTLNAGYKVVNNKEPHKVLGYITFNQFMQLNTCLLKNYYGARHYVIID